MSYQIVFTLISWEIPFTFVDYDVSASLFVTWHFNYVIEFCDYCLWRWRDYVSPPWDEQSYSWFYCLWKTYWQAIKNPRPSLKTSRKKTYPTVECAFLYNHFLWFISHNFSKNNIPNLNAYFRGDSNHGFGFFCISLSLLANSFSLLSILKCVLCKTNKFQTFRVHVYSED